MCPNEDQEDEPDPHSGMRSAASLNCPCQAARGNKNTNLNRMPRFLRYGSKLARMIASVDLHLYLSITSVLLLCCSGCSEEVKSKL